MEAIILAAGYSSRAKTNKMTLHLGKKTVIEHTLAKFDGLCSRVIVVAGFQSPIIEEELEKIKARDVYSFHITLITNEQYNNGMFSSIQAGCHEVRSRSFFVTPGDCPLVKSQTVHLLTKESGDVIIPSYHFKGGHPILLSSKVKEQILLATSDSNLRNVLNQFTKTYINVDDPGILLDVDTPEDFQEATIYYQQTFLHQH